MLSRSLSAIGCVCALAVGGTPVAAQSFQGLGDLPGGGFESSATAISADGSTVVGYSVNSSGRVPVIWRQGAQLRALPGGKGIANGVSADGSVVVGIAYSSGSCAFHYRDADGEATYTLLSPRSGAPVNCGAYGVSADGRWVVGYSHSPGSESGNLRVEATLWDAQNPGDQPRGFGWFPGSISWSQAWAISGDGSTLVGEGRPPTPGSVAFGMPRDAATIAPLATPNPGGWSVATAITPDASTVVGYTRTQGFLLRDGEVAMLASPRGATLARATGVSSDGSVVVGWAAISGMYTTCVWNRAGEVRLLSSVLSTDFGVDISSWPRLQATGVSGDGRTIVGYGVNPSGQAEGFIAVIPAPGLSGLVLIGAMMMRRERWNRGAGFVTPRGGG